jgi:transcriptional regulator
MGGSEFALHGTLDYLILKALAAGAEHGYGIARWIGRVTDQELTVEEGSLYPALHRLERERYLASRWGQTENKRRAKYYRLTASGEKRLREEEGRVSRFAAAVAKVAAARSGS